MATQLAVVIRARDEYSRVLKQAGRETQGFGSRIKGLGLAAGAAFAGAGAAITAFAVSSVRAASDLNEAVNKANVTFGDSAGIIQDFASNSARSFGISKRAANEYTATLGNILLASGLSKRAAADMSVELTQLASDMASFNNIPIDVALDKIRSGLVGEAEPLRAVGVLLSEAAVQAKAMEIGISDGTRALTEGEKVQARFALIMQQTSTAQGDFARTSEGLANQQRILAARFEDTRARIGQLLIPAAAFFFKVLSGGLPIVEATAKGFIEFLKVINRLKAPLTAFGVVIIGALVIPRLIALTTEMATVSLEVIRLTRSFGVMNVLLRTFGGVGLPLAVIAVAALAAGLVFLAQKFLGTRDTSKAAEGALADFTRQNQEAITSLQLAGLTEQEATLRQLATEFGEVAASLQLAQGAAAHYQDEAHRLSETNTAVFDGFSQLSPQLLENSRHLEEAKKRSGALTAEQERLAKAVTKLVAEAPLEEQARLVRDLGLSADFVKRFMPGAAQAIAEAGGSAEQATAQLEPTNAAFNDMVDTLDELASAFSGARSAFDALIGVQTREEALLQAQISGRDLQIARVRELAGTLGQELTPAEEEQIAALERQNEVAQLSIDRMGLERRAGADLAQTLNSQLLPSHEELNTLLGTVASSLSTAEGQFLLNEGAAGRLKAAADTLRLQGLGPVADFIEGTLLPRLSELDKADPEILITTAGFKEVAGPLAGLFRSLRQLKDQQPTQISFEIVPPDLRSLGPLYAHSPSQVGIDIGRGLTEGIALGVEQTSGIVESMGMEMVETQREIGAESGEALAGGMAAGVLSQNIVEVYRQVGGEASAALVSSLLAGAQKARQVSEPLLRSLESVRAFIGDLQGELSRLLNLPTIQNTQQQIRLDELRIQLLDREVRIQEAQAARERVLGSLRDRLARARESGNETVIAFLERQIVATENSRSAVEREAAAIEQQIAIIERSLQRRRLELDILALRGQAADRSTVSENAMRVAAEAMIAAIGRSTVAFSGQAALINTTYIPAMQTAELRAGLLEDVTGILQERMVTAQEPARELAGAVRGVVGPVEALESSIASLDPTFLAAQQRIAGLSGDLRELQQQSPVNIEAILTIVARFGEGGIDIRDIAEVVRGRQRGAWEIRAPELALLHQGEMVLPRHIAEGVRTMAHAGTSAGQSFADIHNLPPDISHAALLRFRRQRAEELQVRQPALVPALAAPAGGGSNSYTFNFTGPFMGNEFESRRFAEQIMDAVRRNERGR